MNQDLLDKVLTCPRLPSLSAIAIDVIELCRQDDINIKQIARTISNDPALSTKILRTVNSSYYGLSQPVSTISHALVILGLNSVRTLALGFTLVSTYKEVGGEKFDMNRVWRRSLYSAVAARSVAQRVGLPEHEEAFLAGLLQDLGLMALIQTLGEPYIHLINQAGDKHHKLARLEQQEFGLDHAVVGEALGKKWNLPPNLTVPIRHHEAPQLAPAELRPMVQAVALGAAAADVFVRDVPVQAARTYLDLSRQWFTIDQTTASELLETIRGGTKEMGKLFEIKTGPAREPGAILAEANEVLLELSLKTQQDATKLEERNRELQVQATTDPLTGAANRGQFNETLTAAFVQAMSRGTPLSLILIDADRFKRVNDMHGHLAGDKVLVAISQALHAHAPEGSLVARYGGEEFCVVLPGVDRRAAARAAEMLRQKVQALAIEVESNVTLKVTVSLGVACFENKSIFQRPEQLIKAADQAVYAAKSAGRNCVRVFAPKVAAAT